MPHFISHKRNITLPKENAESARSWLSIRVNAEKREADVFIYDEISFFGKTALDISQEIQEIDADLINLHINSPGGLVFDGVAIYNLFRQHKATVHTYIDGVAASIASVIAMAGDEIFIADNAQVMIHEPLVLMVGNARDLRKEADVLDQIQETIITTYQHHSDLDREALRDLMEYETWFDAGAAVEHGFATKVIGAREEAASALQKFDFTPFAHVPNGWPVGERGNEPEPIVSGTQTSTDNQKQQVTSAAARERRLAYLQRKYI